MVITTKEAQLESECAEMRAELSVIVAALVEQKTALEVLLETKRNVIDLFPEKYSWLIFL